MNEWNVNDEFKMSGIAQLDTHSPRVKTTGVILELLHNKKARVTLKSVENENNVEAIVHLRDLKRLTDTKG